jgi:hypothetical protein
MKRYFLVLLILLLTSSLGWAEDRYALTTATKGVVSGGVAAAGCSTVEFQNEGTSNLGAVPANQYAYTYWVSKYIPASSFTLCGADVELGSGTATAFDAATLTFVMLADSSGNPVVAGECACTGTVAAAGVTPSTYTYTAFSGCNCTCSDTTNGCWFGFKHDGADANYISTRYASDPSPTGTVHKYFLTDTTWYEESPTSTLRMRLKK